MYKNVTEIIVIEQKKWDGRWVIELLSDRKTKLQWLDVFLSIGFSTSKPDFLYPIYPFFLLLTLNLHLLSTFSPLFIDLLHKNIFLNPVKYLQTVTISYFVRKRNANKFIYGKNT